MPSSGKKAWDAHHVVADEIVEELLAIGRRGTPRKLEVEGENQEKVGYPLIDPQQYARRHVPVVGGGDSALEAAASIAEQPGTVLRFPP